MTFTAGMQTGGGAMRSVSRGAGYFDKRSWSGGQASWGASATSLPLVAGTMLLSELERGRIDHALAISIPQARARAFAWPAQRTDGLSLDPHALPEGAHLRLDPNRDLDRLNLPPLVHTMAEAAQRYGLVVRDKSGGGIGFFAEDWRPTGRNPWWTREGKPRPAGYLGGKWPSVLFARFPWRALEVVDRRRCSARPSEPCPWTR